MRKGFGVMVLLLTRLVVDIESITLMKFVSSPAQTAVAAIKTPLVQAVGMSVGVGEMRETDGKDSALLGEKVSAQKVSSEFGELMILMVSKNL